MHVCKSLFQLFYLKIKDYTEVKTHHPLYNHCTHPLPHLHHNRHSHLHCHHPSQPYCFHPKSVRIPDHRNPFTIIVGLSATYSNASTIHLAPSSFNNGILRSTGCRCIDSSSGLHPWNWSSICEAYQSSNFFRMYSFIGLMTERSIGCNSLSVVLGGRSETWMLFWSRSSVILEGVWPLKLSMITSAGSSSPKSSRSLSTYGMIISWMCSTIVDSVDQCRGEWVMFQSIGKENFGTAPWCFPLHTTLHRKEVTEQGSHKVWL